MSQLTTTGGTELAAVTDFTGDVALVARNPEEMQAAQGALAQWFANKAAIVRKDQADLEECVRQGDRAGMNVAPLKRQATITRKRAEFYEKCQLACEAGYCVVPNMPGEAFAIRTDRDPNQHVETTWRPGAHVNREYPANLPAGAGTNVDAVPRESRGSFLTHNKDGKEVRTYWAEDDGHAEIEFPISVAKPLVMAETTRALALKVFDELQVLPGRKSRKVDPLVLGVVNYPGSKFEHDRKVTFLIAWYLDTSTIP